MTLDSASLDGAAAMDAEVDSEPIEMEDAGVDRGPDLGNDGGCVPNPPERCNDADDDCDGQIDEDFDVGGACEVGQGACRREGQLECGPDGAARCSAVEGERAALEACDGIDADCDGVGDEVDDETTAASCRRCAADDQTSPCNGCPEGTYIPAGFVCVPAGAPGRMGSPEGETGRSADREALHQIEITRPFLLGAAEVTQGEWTAQGLANPSDHQDEPGCGLECGRLPVEQLSWHEALVYLNRRSVAEGLTPCYGLEQCRNADDLGTGCANGEACSADYVCPSDEDLLVFESIHACTGYRLPSEAEWEYAVRAGAAQHEAVYGSADWAVGGDGCADALQTKAWYYCTVEGNPGHPQRVRQKDANRWGLFDMLGNVYELTWDEFRSDRANLQDLVDPVIPPTSGSASPTRAIRGGGFENQAGQVRSAQRSAASPRDRRRFLGFRAARSLPHQPPPVGE